MDKKKIVKMDLWEAVGEVAKDHCVYCLQELADISKTLSPGQESTKVYASPDLNAYGNQTGWHFHTASEIKKIRAEKKHSVVLDMETEKEI